MLTAYGYVLILSNVFSVYTESLISARGSAFKDTTALPALLDCYALVHAVPSTSPFSKQVHIIHCT